MEVVCGLDGELEELRETFRSGKTKEASWRRSQLQALLSLLEEREAEIMEALKQDIGKHPNESYRDEVFYIFLKRLHRDKMYFMYKRS